MPIDSGYNELICSMKLKISEKSEYCFDCVQSIDRFHSNAIETRGQVGMDAVPKSHMCRTCDEYYPYLTRTFSLSPSPSLSRTACVMHMHFKYHKLWQ